MISILVDLQNVDECTEKTIKIPSNDVSEIQNPQDFVVVDSVPYIPYIQNMCINDINDIVEEINAENSEMTAELLGAIMEAIDGSLDDEEFVHRIKTNDFLFEDLSDLVCKTSNEEVAAYYIATVLKFPFEDGITDDVIEFLKNDEIGVYINWKNVWDEYVSRGFGLIEIFDPDGYSLYLIHWK